MRRSPALRALALGATALFAAADVFARAGGGGHGGSSGGGGGHSSSGGGHSFGSGGGGGGIGGLIVLLIIGLIFWYVFKRINRGTGAGAIGEVPPGPRLRLKPCLPPWARRWVRRRLGAAARRH